MKNSRQRVVVINFKKEFNLSIESNFHTLSKIQMETNKSVIICLPSVIDSKQENGRIKLA
ncbi:hypothetical protein H1Q59_04340 [Holosporaceae bacterium 'Namur']|nr:hypothetical protein [Holosporaceae bacterium 'Namur']